MRPSRSWLPGVLAALLLAYLATGFYFVRADERGVVRWFGRPGRVVQPGLHYALPRPFCEVDRPRTEEIRRVHVGMDPRQRDAIVRGDMDAIIRTSETDLLTGDVNILKVTLVVQYQILDPADYLFETSAPDALVEQVVETILVESLSGLPVDEALTARKAWLQLTVMERSQEVLDGYGTGVRLVSTTFDAITPPRAIVDAFQDVVSASKDAERLIDEAVAGSNNALAEARGLAVESEEAALAYRSTRLGRARGEAARFRSLLTEYRREPEVVRERLLLERMEKVLPRLRTIIVDDPDDGAPTDLRVIDRGER